MDGNKNFPLRDSQVLSPVSCAQISAVNMGGWSDTAQRPLKLRNDPILGASEACLLPGLEGPIFLATKTTTTDPRMSSLQHWEYGPREKETS